MCLQIETDGSGTNTAFRARNNSNLYIRPDPKCFVVVREIPFWMMLFPLLLHTSKNESSFVQCVVVKTQKPPRNSLRKNSRKKLGLLVTDLKNLKAKQRKYESCTKKSVKAMVDLI